MTRQKPDRDITSHDVSHIYSDEYFSNQVDGYREFSDFDGSFNALFDRYRRNILLLDLRQEHHFLDIGCGRGEVCIYHALRGGKAAGLDYSEPAIDMARQKAIALGAEVAFQCASFRDAAIDDAGFDRILASEFIEHISKEEGEAFFLRAYAALKPGGKLLVFTYPNTLQRRYGYPLIYLYSLIAGKPVPWRQPDTVSEHYRLYHLNEQHIFSMERMAKKAGFRQITTAYDIINKPVGLLKRLVQRTPLRHIFLNNLYLIAEK